MGPDSPRPTPSLPPAPMPNICGSTRRVIVSLTPSRVDRVEGAGVTLTQLIEMIAPEVERPIIDHTDSPRTSHTNWTSLPRRCSALNPEPLSTCSQRCRPVNYALKEQLGLELKPSRGPVDVLVMSMSDDHQTTEDLGFGWQMNLSKTAWARNCVVIPVAEAPGEPTQPNPTRLAGNCLEFSAR